MISDAETSAPDDMARPDWKANESYSRSDPPAHPQNIKSCLSIHSEPDLHDYHGCNDHERGFPSLVVRSLHKQTWRVRAILFLILVVSLVLVIQEANDSPHDASLAVDDLSFGVHNLQTVISTPVERGVENIRQASPSPTSTSVLECFQVYEPVLTPAGPVDQITAVNGESDTVVLEKTSETESCTVVLMDHVFAYSYGQPFVSKSKKACFSE